MAACGRAVGLATYTPCRLVASPPSPPRVAAGGDLYSYMDGTDLAVFYQFVSRQSASTRYHAVATCAGYGAYWDPPWSITGMVRGAVARPAASCQQCLAPNLMMCLCPFTPALCPQASTYFCYTAD
jgi:hypothetical protein